MTHAAELRRQLDEACHRKDWPRTQAIASQLLSIVPGDADVHLAAGTANLEMRRMQSALHHLQRATTLAPGRADAVLQWARALALAKQPGEAKEAADRVRLMSPDAAMLAMLGAIYADAGAYDDALSAYRDAAQQAPDQASYQYNLAAAWISVGNVDEAEKAIEACLALDPRFARAHLTLAHLRKQRPGNNHVAQLEQWLAGGSFDDAGHVCLHMALAKELDDLGHYAASFNHLSRGKAIASRGVRYDASRDEMLCAALARAFPETPSLQHAGSTSEEPIFVFGLPRTGTTLVERILASHPDVHGAGELLNFGMALRRHWGQRPPLWEDAAIAAHATQVNWRDVGETYVASTRPQTGHTARFVDKFPFNFLYAGFIACAMPHAKLVCLRRHPMDSCLGNFRQLFAEKLPYYDYSFDLLDTGRYYVQFDRLMAHWQRVFPGRILELSYEALVTDPTTAISELLAFCGLPWNDACLRSEALPTAVATASALQVREPIHARAVGQWHRYEEQLRDLRDLLAQAGVSIDKHA